MDENISPAAAHGSVDCVALVVGAGRGSRAGDGAPKQYRDIGGEPLIRTTLRAFAQHDGVDHVCAVIHPDDETLFGEACAGLDIMASVHGGASRQESVLCGLRHIAALNPRTVLIHDAARPFVSAALISRVLGALDEHAGAIPALRVVDTLKRGRDANDRREPVIAETVPRDGLWRAQTPQGFRFTDIISAHETFAAQCLTDDAAIAEAAGMDVALVSGDEGNIKVTTADDIVRAAEMAGGRHETRSGLGYDVHRFSEGDHVTLCGVEIAHTATLAGHSDADVAIHALCDAIYGAMAEGDIGAHFPPSDAQWKGVASDIFLSHAVSMLRDKGGRIVNVDVTLVCERPKIGPHRAAMVQRLAEIMAIEPARISVKATTTERLGFTGREEGVAAQAMAVVSLPSA